MSRSMKNLLLTAKEETVSGTDAAPTAAVNSILCRGFMPSLIEAEFVERNLIRGAKGNYGQLAVGEHRIFEFEVELAGSGAAGTAPKWAPLLKACGFNETLTASTSAVYALVGGGEPTLTLYGYLDGQLFKMVRSKGDVSFELNAKSIPVMKFRFIGQYSAGTDVTFPTTASFTGFQQPLTVGKVNTPTFSFFGITPPMQGFTFNLANQLVWREMVNLSGPVSPDRKPAGQAVIELPDTIAAMNWSETVRLGTTGTCQLLHGTTAGNRVQLDFPKLQVAGKPTLSNDNEIAMLTVPFSAQPNSGAGNDEFVLTCT